MGFLSDLDKKLTDNVYEHGSQLTDPAADLPQTVGEIVERLMPFVQPEARETVKAQILGLIHEYKAERTRSAAEQDHPD
ncbi:hypothetical protein [Mesorhizobium sp. B2-6-1]|uniref:hypothetical protein n=1 Tax=Mesorhizobium sp. B2-6-1 TaxID=2589916 RepID=UPI00112CF1EA|nr:hypothetical protein [Mesorhizobium sp. B2-6-1]TPJ65722.1 hypothetical protein FJ443_07415 [Mesorhizobium sp. B2-6-1]